MATVASTSQAPAANRRISWLEVLSQAWTWLFLGILIQVHLLDTKNYLKGAEFSQYLADRIQSLNRRTLDSLSAKVYFYYSLFCEHLARQEMYTRAGREMLTRTQR